MQAILEGRREWGISCHRVAPGFDTGAVLDSERFALDADECHETLQLRLQMAARRLARSMARTMTRRRCPAIGKTSLIRLIFSGRFPHICAPTSP
jgi:methionyl-tRNA formyltransferase